MGEDFIRMVHPCYPGRFLVRDEGGDSRDEHEIWEGDQGHSIHGDRPGIKGGLSAPCRWIGINILPIGARLPQIIRTQSAGAVKSVGSHTWGMGRCRVVSRYTIPIMIQGIRMRGSGAYVQHAT